MASAVRTRNCRKSVMPMASASKRASKFNPPDTKALLLCIDKYKDSVESKKTNSATLYNKRKSWQNITEEFNSCAKVKRDTSQLKRFWERHKALRKSAQEKCESMHTGVGPPNDLWLGIEMPVMDSEYHYFKTEVSSYDPLKVSDSPDEEECIVGVSSAGHDLSTSSTVLTVEADVVAEDSCDPNPLLLEQSSESSHRSSRKRRFQKLSDEDSELKFCQQRIEDQRERDQELHVLRLAQHRQLHEVQLQSEQAHGAVRNQEELRRSKLQEECDSKLHQLRVEHLRQLHAIELQLKKNELEHQNAVNSIRLQKEQLELKLVQQSMKE